MAWEGIKSAIPPALIQILIEKVISMIVPAVGAVLAIIEGLQAAWGTVSRVIQAFDRFMGFLKAVKTGQSGPQFGAALAAAGVVLIDFVSNWLLKRVRGAASKVAGKIKEIAKKIGRKLKAATKKLGGKFDKVKDKFFGKKGGKEGKEQARDGKNGNANKEDAKQQEIQKRVEKVKRELPPKIKSFLAKKPSKLRVIAQLAIWRVAYRLKKLDLNGKEGKLDFIGQVNPTIDLADGWTFDTKQVFSVLDKIASEYITTAKTSKEGTQEEVIEPVSRESREPGAPSVGLDDRQAYRDGTTKTGESVPVTSGGKTSTTQTESTNIKSLDVKEPGTAVANLDDRQAYQIATTESGSPVGYKHQPSRIKEEWQEIAGLESEGHMYPVLKSKLAGVEVGEIFAKILRGEPVPDLPQEKKEAIGELFGLWYAKEPSHPKGTQKHRRDLVYSLMITQLMTPEKGKEHLNIDQGIDLHPASFGGAQAGARRVTSEMVEGKAPPRERKKRREKPDQQPRQRKTLREKRIVPRRVTSEMVEGKTPPRQRKTLREKRDERYRREKDTIKAWFQSHVKALPVLEREPTIDDVETFVRQQLQKYLKGE